MKINIYKRPDGDELIVENSSVYEYMTENSLKEFSFGLLMHINDYEWHHDYGVGSPNPKVFESYDIAKNFKKVYPAPEYDRNDCWSDIPIKVTITKQAEAGKIQISVDSENEPIFDILSPNDINRIIPI